MVLSEISLTPLLLHNHGPELGADLRNWLTAIQATSHRSIRRLPALSCVCCVSSLFMRSGTVRQEYYYKAISQFLECRRASARACLGWPESGSVKLVPDLWPQGQLSVWQCCMQIQPWTLFDTFGTHVWCICGSESVIVSLVVRWPMNVLKFDN